MPKPSRRPARTRPSPTTVESNRTTPVSKATSRDTVWDELESEMAEGRDQARSRGQATSLHDDLYDDDGLPV
ncbi:MAG: hypothetical protein IV100_19760 [Myxococcales bacterium]|nr:hypothetical protein [Myxococcales bacterium]